MMNVQEIEQAISQLPPEDLAALRAWFAEFDAGVWDRQFEEDVAAGRLDALADKPVNDPPRPRVAGLHVGALQAAPDFDAPLPDDFWAGQFS